MATTDPYKERFVLDFLPEHHDRVLFSEIEDLLQANGWRRTPFFGCDEYIEHCEKTGDGDVRQLKRLRDELDAQGKQYTTER